MGLKPVRRGFGEVRVERHPIVSISKPGICAAIIQVHAYHEQSVGTALGYSPAIEHYPVAFFGVCVIITHAEHRMAAAVVEVVPACAIFGLPDSAFRLVAPEVKEFSPRCLVGEEESKPYALSLA